MNVKNRQETARTTYLRFLAVLTILIGTLPFVQATGPQAVPAVYASDDGLPEETSAIEAEPGGTLMASALEMAQALVEDDSWIDSSTILNQPAAGTADVFSSPLTSFPTGSDDTAYVALTTGYTSSIPYPDTFASDSLGGGNVRGDSDYDVTVWEIVLDTPVGTNCLQLDFQFFSEEYPRYVGGSYNDAFIAEWDVSDWTTSGSDITATHNFAFDTNGDVISINSTGVGGLSSANATGTACEQGTNNTDGGATVLLSARNPIPSAGGIHTLTLSIFDQGDRALDSFVFLDNLQLLTVPEGTCLAGASTNWPPVAADDSFTVAANSSGNTLDVLGNDSDADDDSLSISDVGATDNGGTATNNGTDITYTPATDFSGTEVFTYTVSDGNGGSDTATVTVDVSESYGSCTPLDIVYVVDDTGSMGGALGSIQGQLTDIISDVQEVSAGDYRQGLLTFDDDVQVLDDMAAGNDASIQSHINGLSANGGNGWPEASDEGLNTAINSLAASDRGTTGGTPDQTGDFNATWRADAYKILVIITDATPGGFDDTYTAGVDDVNAHTRATEATAAGINIAAIYVPTTSDPVAAAIMQDYALTTDGVYTETASDGTGTAAALRQIIAECGGAISETPLEIEKTAEDIDGDPLYPGDTIRYTIRITNSTSISHTNVVVTDTLPGEVTFDSATPGGYSGPNPLVWNVGTLNPDDTWTAVITTTVNTDATSVSGNVAEVDSDDMDPEETPPVTPPGGGDVTESADLAIDKDFLRGLFVVTFTVTVDNYGPGDAVGAIMSDTLPVEMTDVTWTCTASGSATCGGSGTGDVYDTINLPVGEQIVYTIVGDLDLFASPPNTAEVIPPVGTEDSDMENNRATTPSGYRYLLPIIYRNADPSRMVKNRP